MTSLSANLVSFDYILILCILATLFNQPRLCYTQNQFWVNWVISDWVIVLCLITQSCLTLTLWTVAPPGFSVHGDSPGKNPEVGCHALLEETFPKAGIKPKSLASQADSLPSEPLGKSFHSLILVNKFFKTPQTIMGPWDTLIPHTLSKFIVIHFHSLYMWTPRKYCYYHFIHTDLALE